MGDWPNRITCGTCRYSETWPADFDQAVMEERVRLLEQRSGRTLGFVECRFHAPVAVPDVTGDRVRTGWPVVSVSDWCREGKLV
jgi:acyl dehydratase